MSNPRAIPSCIIIHYTRCKEAPRRAILLMKYVATTLPTISRQYKKHFNAAYGWKMYISAIFLQQYMAHYFVFTWATYMASMATMADELIRVAAAYIVLKAKSKPNKPRKMWIRPYFNKRDTIDILSLEIRLDEQLFKNFTRMSKSDFELIIHKIGPTIQRTDTNMRKAIPVVTRLAITLRFLATGDSYKSLSYLFRVSDSSISAIIPEVCAALTEGLKEYIKMPSGAAEWKEVAKDFEDRWNFPHCLGAMDGKHVAITCPPNSGSQYFNYKHFFSIVLFAVTDARYNFLYVHAGVQGRISDGGVFRHTAFGKALLDQNLNIPDPEALPGREMLTPYVFLADDAFPLTENICKPYTIDLNVGSPKRVCNYRISRARRIVENSFGILASVFRILHTTIDVELKYVQHIVLACVYLHNFLRRSTRAQALYSPPGSFDCEDIDVGTLIPGSWRADDHRLTNLRTLGRNAATQAKAMRDEFMHYFMSEQGRVEWQDKYLTGASSNP